ncbi:MAG: hypothetical protein JO115_09440 [Pseudonocardiales bacterium]|nr:hypothetical protein [Pseudonocardiales bacterium]
MSAPCRDGSGRPDVEVAEVGPAQQQVATPAAVLREARPEPQVRPGADLGLGVRS